MLRNFGTKSFLAPQIAHSSQHHLFIQALVTKNERGDSADLTQFCPMRSKKLLWALQFQWSFGHNHLLPNLCPKNSSPRLTDRQTERSWVVSGGDQKNHAFPLFFVLWSSLNLVKLFQSRNHSSIQTSSILQAHPNPHSPILIWALLPTNKVFLRICPNP